MQVVGSNKLDSLIGQPLNSTNLIVTPPINVDEPGLVSRDRFVLSNSDSHYKRKFHFLVIKIVSQES